MSETTVIAIKNGKKRKFTEYNWNLMGKDKNGWTKIEDKIVSNSLEKPIVTAPSTGEKKTIPVTNSVENSAASVSEANDGTKETKEISVSNNVNEISEEKKAEFMKAVDGFTKDMIKNYFDNRPTAVEYGKRDGIDSLKEKLGEYLKYDLVELQKAFSL